MSNNQNPMNHSFFPNDPIAQSNNSIFSDIDQSLFNSNYNNNHSRMMPSIPQVSQTNSHDISSLLSNQNTNVFLNNNNDMNLFSSSPSHQIQQQSKPQQERTQQFPPIFPQLNNYDFPPPKPKPPSPPPIQQQSIKSSIQFSSLPQNSSSSQYGSQTQQSSQPDFNSHQVYSQIPHLQPNVQQEQYQQIFPQQQPKSQIPPPNQFQQYPQTQYIQNQPNQNQYSSYQQQQPPYHNLQQQQQKPQTQYPHLQQQSIHPSSVVLPQQANIQAQIPGQMYNQIPGIPQLGQYPVRGQMMPNSPQMPSSSYILLMNQLKQNLPPGAHLTPLQQFQMCQLLMRKNMGLQPGRPKTNNSSSNNDNFITNDDDEGEPVDDLPSSEEGSFSSSSENETDFENLPDDYVPDSDEVVIDRKAQLREHRKSTKHEDSESYLNFEEEDIPEAEQSIVSEDLLEHVFMSRVKDGGLEYLVRFQESPPALCQWVPECIVIVIPNAKGHLERFKSAPFGLEDIPEDSDYLYPVAHRRDNITDRPELLFRFAYDNTILFYWDLPDEKTLNKYFNSRVRINASEPEVPNPETLPVPDKYTISSKGDNKTMRDYQVEGLKWLIKCWDHHHGSILADEMGLGKTIQLLSFLTFLNKNTEWKGPYLIAVRTNTFKQWCDEIERWTDLKYLPYNSGPSQRAIMREHQFPALDDLGHPIPNTYAFHIFLVSYDVLLKDVEFISSITWQVFVVDEGHRIKNSQGKKNNAMSSVNALQRIILTGTPIQNSLKELWALLRFVSPKEFEEDPEFLENDLEDMTHEQVLETRNMIKPHLLRRSLQEVEHSIAPKDERVAFVQLTQVQRDLVRLTKLHKLWRLKGVQTSEEEMDASNEGIAILKICSHPFLLPEAEEYYTKKMGHLKRVDLLMAVSAKFQWLSRLLRVLSREGHRVLIFSQRVELIRILNEFCQLSGYVTEVLIGSMNDTDKTQAIERFSAENSKAFIFLISTRAGSEGLNLTVANTAIIFDPDWNPQNDLQAQARCHRIGQTQKVDVLRLITYQTYEHEMFVRAQRKLGLWLTLLGTKTLEDISYQKSNLEPIEKPPEINSIPIDTQLSLDNTLHSISSIVHDFSLDCLSSLEEPLKERIDYSSNLSDDSFVEQFPVSLEAPTRRTKHSRSRDLLIDYSASMKIYKIFQKYGYGEWEQISENLQEHSTEQIRRFCVCLTIFAFRAMQPTNITYLPCLVSRVLVEEPDFEFEMLLCSNKHTWSQVFPEDHDYALEVDSCKKLRDELKENAFLFLSVIEMRLIAKSWCSFNQKDSFDIDTLIPPVTDSDANIYNAIINHGDFDPFNLRVQAIINKMRSDIITAKLDDFAMTFQWWSGIEFNNVLSVMKNFKFEYSSYEDFTPFHAKTTIMSKKTYEVKTFTLRLRKLLDKRVKGSVVIPKDVHNMKKAPKVLQSSKGFTAWTNILVRECEDIAFREELINLIIKKVNEMPDAVESEDTTTWTDYHTKKYLKCLLQHGIDSMTSILIDRRYGFKKFLSQTDIDFINGVKKRRNLATSSLPEFLFNEDELFAYLKGERDSFVPDDGKVAFQFPSTQKVNFEMGQAPRKKLQNIESFLNPSGPLDMQEIGIDQNTPQNTHRMREEDFYDDDFYPQEMAQTGHHVVNGMISPGAIQMDPYGGAAYHHAYRNHQQPISTIRKTRQRNAKRRNDSDDFEADMDDDDDDDIGDIEDDDSNDFQPDD
ncbi:hypothetical protein M9Y10_043477 [Tritrichomonas musculus]|uniref:SNF2 family N-terminal domain containing protein n=1 Tax=Tritrichomonas musculus TaxID=1915356 RepID=A0ABR2K075_9EUKA